jgi:hypothetical protein
VVNKDLSFHISVTDGNDIRALFLIFVKLKGQLSQLLLFQCALDAWVVAAKWKNEFPSPQNPF